MSAVISPCGRYRYRLGRQICTSSRGLGTCLFIMLNPSTADAELDDQTIRKCIKYAKTWGYVGLDVVNLFAWRATDPREVLCNLADANNDDAFRHLSEAIRAADLIVCAWGNGIPRADGRAATKERAASVLEWIRDAGKVPHRLGPLTKQGHPNHPLYLKDSLTPEPMP